MPQPAVPVRPTSELSDDEFAKLACRAVLRGARCKLTDDEIVERAHRLDHMRIQAATLELILAGQVLVDWDADSELLVRARRAT